MCDQGLELLTGRNEGDGNKETLVPQPLPCKTGTYHQVTLQDQLNIPPTPGAGAYYTGGTKRPGPEMGGVKVRPVTTTTKANVSISIAMFHALLKPPTSDKVL